MNRPFTQREKALILVLAVLLLAVGYLKLFLEPLNDSIATAQLQAADAETAEMTETLKLQQCKQMQEQLEKWKAEGISQAEIPDYDNVENVMVQLDAILSSAEKYSLTFPDVEIGDQLVQRPVDLSFEAANYKVAHQILTNLHQCWYRCTLNDLTVQSKTDVNTGAVAVTVTVTFYERNTQPFIEEAQE